MYKGDLAYMTDGFVGFVRRFWQWEEDTEGRELVVEVDLLVQKIDAARWRTNPTSTVFLDGRQVNQAVMFRKESASVLKIIVPYQFR